MDKRFHDYVLKRLAKYDEVTAPDFVLQGTSPDWENRAVLKLKRQPLNVRDETDAIQSVTCYTVGLVGVPTEALNKGMDLEFFFIHEQAVAIQAFVSRCGKTAVDKPTGLGYDREAFHRELQLQLQELPLGWTSGPAGYVVST